MTTCPMGMWDVLKALGVEQYFALPVYPFSSHFPPKICQGYLFSNFMIARHTCCLNGLNKPQHCSLKLIIVHLFLIPVNFIFFGTAGSDHWRLKYTKVQPPWLYHSPQVKTDSVPGPNLGDWIPLRRRENISHHQNLPTTQRSWMDWAWLGS